MKYIAVLGLLLTSCVGPGSAKGAIHVTNIKGGLTDVCTRHDAYVKADTSLSPEQKEIFLSTSELLLRVVAEAEAK